MEVGNRFKGLDLIDRVPDELWTEVCDIVHETGSKTIPKKEKCKKAKWLFEEALQKAVKRREAKSKGEEEIYIHLNAEFQRIARRDKEAFLPISAKKERKTIEWERLEIPSIRGTKGRFNAKMGSIKDRNGMDLQKQKILRRGGKNTQTNYTKKI